MFDHDLLQNTRRYITHLFRILTLHHSYTPNIDVTSLSNKINLLKYKIRYLKYIDFKHFKAPRREKIINNKEGPSEK